MEIPAFDRMFKIIMGGLNCWGFILNAIFLALFYKFAFDNPDPE